jgi:CelD/BcsL family acetyltransferase involved in cellulose biosynthesis
VVLGPGRPTGRRTQIGRVSGSMARCRRRRGDCEPSPEISAGRYPHFLLSFDWCWNAWNLVAEPRGCKLRLVTGWEGERLVLAWPLTVENGVLRMLSSETLEYRDILVEPCARAPQWIDEAWSYVTSSIRASIFFFQNLRHPSVLAQKLSRVSKADPVRANWCPVIRLDRFADWDAYAATLPRSLTSDQRRQWRRVRRILPGLSFRLADEPDRIRSIINWVGRHKIIWGRSRGNSPVWFGNEDKRSFLQSVAEAKYNAGQLVLGTLSDGDTVLSAGWGYSDGHTFLFHAFAYDAAFSTYSPSRLLLEGFLRHCFETGIHTFDLMPGEQPFKRIWATDYLRTDSYVGPLNRRGAWVLHVLGHRSAAIGTRAASGQAQQTLSGAVRRYILRRLGLPTALLTPGSEDVFEPEKANGREEVHVRVPAGNEYVDGEPWSDVIAMGDHSRSSGERAA